MLKKFLNKINDYSRIIIFNTLGLLICKAVSILVTFVLFPVYIAFFGNNQVLGVWFTIVAILNWVLIFDLGLGNGLRNKLPEALAQNNKELAKQYISSTYIASACFALCVGLGFFFISGYINWNYLLHIDIAYISAPVLTKCVRIIITGLLLQFVLKLVTSILYALQKAFLVNVIGLISNVLILIVLKTLSSSTLEDNLVTMAYVNCLAINLPMLVFTFWIFQKELRDMVPSCEFFRKDMCKELLGIGLTLLWLQLIFLVVANTNEFLISYLAQPENVVDYQAYYKLYSTGAVVFSFALTPVWSAVTKAKAEKNYMWIKKAYKFFLLACVACFCIELAVSVVAQSIFDIWLGSNKFSFNMFYGFIFAIHSTIFILHNVNTSISNGLSYFKFQMLGMTIAAILDFPLAYVFVHYFNSWIGVMLASSVAMLFYELLAPYFTMKYIDTLN